MKKQNTFEISIYRDPNHMKKQEKGIFFDTVEVWPNPNKGVHTISIHKYDEVSCLNQKGEPCMCNVCVMYVPDEHVLELKSLKYILSRFRDTYCTAESITKYVADQYEQNTYPHSMIIGTYMVNLVDEKDITTCVIERVRHISSSDQVNTKPKMKEYIFNDTKSYESFVENIEKISSIE